MALTGTLALALTASFQRRSYTHCAGAKWWQVRRTRISSVKLLSSPISALTASKSNTNCVRTAGSVLQGQMHNSWRGRVRAPPHLRDGGRSSPAWCRHCREHFHSHAGSPPRYRHLDLQLEPCRRYQTCTLRADRGVTARQRLRGIETTGDPAWNSCQRAHMGWVFCARSARSPCPRSGKFWGGWRPL